MLYWLLTYTVMVCNTSKRLLICNQTGSSEIDWFLWWRTNSPGLCWNNSTRLWLTILANAVVLYPSVQCSIILGAHERLVGHLVPFSRHWMQSPLTHYTVVCWVVHNTSVCKLLVNLNSNLVAVAVHEIPALSVHTTKELQFVWIFVPQTPRRALPLDPTDDFCFPDTLWILH